MYSTCLSVRPSVCSFVCYQTCEHNVLKAKEPTLMPSGAHSKSIKPSILGSGVKVQGHMMPNIFEVMAEASVSTLLGRRAFLVYISV